MIGEPLLTPTKQIQKGHLIGIRAEGVMNDERVRANEPARAARIVETLDALYSVRASNDRNQERIDNFLIRRAHARLERLKIPYELGRKCIGPHAFLLRREIWWVASRNEETDGTSC